MFYQSSIWVAEPAPIAVSSFRPPLDEARGFYRVRFARTELDRIACCRLRYEVFNLELGEGLQQSELTGLDQDEYDDHCNHLMVIEERTGNVVGTYRMQTDELAAAHGGYYSASEYDLSEVPAEMMGRAVELGRACIAREHRNKAVFFLLWRGLMAYLLWNSKRYLFGCSSLTSQNPEEGLQAYDWLLREGHVREDFQTAPLPGYVCDAGRHETFTGEFEIPKLFSTYLRNGAKICGPPALDRFFGTIDFLTLLDLEDFDARLGRALALELPSR